jgi:hypothetical protein
LLLSLLPLLRLLLLLLLLLLSVLLPALPVLPLVMSNSLFDDGEGGCVPGSRSDGWCDGAGADESAG